jgi:formylglycine-generating enzyme required for sulfatase activity
VIQSVHLDARGYSVEGESRPIELGRPLELAPGSYLLAASAPDRYPTRYPVALGRGEDARVEIPLPLAAAVPTGFVFVPAGLSLVGTDDVEDVRMPLSAEPEHPASVNAFLIGEYELTYAEYLEFLASLSPEGRAARRPLHLDYDPLGVARLTIDKTTTPRGDAMCRVRQGVRVCRDWLRFPVGGIGWDDAVAYVAWLAERHVPGAHLCTKREWERAARGADGRRYPYGNVSHPGDANDGSETAEGKGPDEVGSFPRDRSPFGVYDLGGNVGEWVTSKERRETRGGDWFFNNDGINSRAAIPTLRNGDRWWTNGARVCAAWPTSP